MSSELLYTSAPQGLKGGSRGFTTVLCTAGMPPNLADKLESFSGYKHIYSPQDPLAEYNPVRYAYLRPSVGGRSVVVVSRLAAYGVDYSGRSNKLAHHIVLEGSERPAGGPAWLLSQHYIWKAVWDGECKTLTSGPQIPIGSKSADVCRQWHEVTGDAGWGGQLVTWLKESSKPVWLIYDPKQQEYILELLVEALALLPEAERWKYTFATYFPGLPSDVDCRIRGVVVGSDEARLASARGYVIDLNRSLPLAATSVWIEAARTGIATSTPVAEPSSRQLQSRSDAALGLVEAPQLAEIESIQSSWPDVSHRSSESNLPVVLPQGLDDYNLAPPPVPTAPSSAIPPALPMQRGSDSNSSSLRWALSAFAVIVLLVIVGAVYALKNDLVRRSTAMVAQSAASPRQGSTIGEEDVAAEAYKNAPSEQHRADHIANSDSPKKNAPPSGGTDKKYGEELVRVSLWACNGDAREELAVWREGDSKTEFLLSVPENLIGKTRYEVTASEDVALSISEPRLGLEEGRVLIKERYNYELMESKDVVSVINIIKGDMGFVIPIKVSVTDEDEFVMIEPISRTIDVSREVSVVVNIKELYGDKLTDIREFSFGVQSDPKGLYGTLVKDGDSIRYELAKPLVDLGNDATEEFVYTIAFRGHEKQFSKVTIHFAGQRRSENGIPISSARTNGDYVEFDFESIKSVFNKPATFELQIVGSTGRVGEVCELVMEKKGLGVSNQIDKKKVWNGLGEVYFNPGKSRETDPRPKIFFSDDFSENEFVRQVRGLFIERQFRLYVKRLVEKNIDNLEAKVASIDSSSDSIQKKVTEKGMCVDLLSKYKSMLKRYAGSKRSDAFAVLSLLDKDRARAELERLVQEALRGCPEGEVKSGIQVCIEPVLAEYSKAQEFISQCRLVVSEVQRDVATSNNAPPVSSKSIPPIGN